MDEVFFIIHIHLISYVLLINYRSNKVLSMLDNLGANLKDCRSKKESHN